MVTVVPGLGGLFQSVHVPNNSVEPTYTFCQRGCGKQWGRDEKSLRLFFSETCGLFLIALPHGNKEGLGATSPYPQRNSSLQQRIIISILYHPLHFQASVYLERWQTISETASKQLLVSKSISKDFVADFWPLCMLLNFLFARLNSPVLFS